MGGEGVRVVRLRNHGAEGETILLEALRYESLSSPHRYRHRQGTEGRQDGQTC